MALKQPLFFENNTTSQNADEVRLLVKGLLGGVTGATSGVAHPDHFKVTEKSGTPGMSVAVAAGHLFIEGSRNSAQGTYHVYNDATVNVPLSESDSTNPRIDIVYVRVRDSAYDVGFDGDDDAEIVVAEGTPAPVPDPPTITDEDYIELARVTVGAGVLAIEDADIEDVRAASSVWTRPRGVVDAKVVTANQSAITTITDLTGLSITFDAEAGRRYRVQCTALIQVQLAGGEAVGSFRTGGNAVVGRWADHFGVTGNLQSQCTGFIVVTPGAGSVTYKASLQNGTDTGTVGIAAGSQFPATFVIEDIGGYLP